MIFIENVYEFFPLYHNPSFPFVHYSNRQIVCGYRVKIGTQRPLP
jgi:hypothetical protein